MDLLRRLLGDRSASRARLGVWPRDMPSLGEYENDPIRFEYDICMEEYRSTHSEILLYHELAHNTWNYTILIWGAILAAAQFIGPETQEMVARYPFVLLVAAILLSAIGLIHVQYEIFISRLGGYVDEVLNPRLRAIIVSRAPARDPYYAAHTPHSFDFMQHWTGKQLAFVPALVNAVTTLVYYAFLFSLSLASFAAYVAIRWPARCNLDIAEQILLGTVILIYVSAIIGILVNAGIVARFRRDTRLEKT